MADMVNEIIKGRKTFFIVPDDTLLAQYFLQEYLYKDYECYFIYNDGKKSIEEKVDKILTLFTDAIIFFNIDYSVHGLEWQSYIATVNEKFPNAVIGVTYLKRNSLSERVSIERKYLYDIGIKGGCIQLEYQQNTNFVKIEKVLKANQAMGRRSTIRAFCYNSCFFSFENSKGDIIQQNISELSVSHFSIKVKKESQNFANLNFKEFERIPKCTFLIRGVRFISDAILYMKRETQDEVLFVFAFANEDKIGLDMQKRHMVMRKMYEIMNDRFNDILLDDNGLIPLDVIVKKVNALGGIDFDESLEEQIIR